MPGCQLVNPILESLIEDSYTIIRGSSKNAIRCLTYARRRLLNEGEAFATKILPRFAKHILMSIERGYITRISDFSYDKRAAYPRFLKGLLMMIFEESGAVKSNPDATALGCTLQILQAFSKYEGACKENHKYEQIKKFVISDGALSPEGWEQQEGVKEILLKATDLVTHIFSEFSARDLVPRPGSGAEASHLPYCFRFRPSLVPASANKYFDYSQYHYVNDNHLFDAFSTYSSADIESCIPARLEAVPKTSDGWRLISVVANGYMWLQQGLKDLLYPYLESHKETSGRVNFTDQTINGDIAMQSSIDGKFATLDMKEASDNVTKDHVRIAFNGLPWLRDLLLSLSETEISYKLSPSGKRKVMKCKKFAPMGSALCFPVMSVLHYVFGQAVFEYNGVPLHEREMYVYGDDLICRSDHSALLLEWFPRLGLIFNPNKCFIKSHFRESCGTNALNGVSVTPTRIKKHLSSIRMPETKQAYVAYEYNLFKKGFKRTARKLRVLLRPHLINLGFGKKLSAPYITGPDTKVLGYVRPYDASRFNNNLFFKNKHGIYKARMWDSNYQSWRFLAPCTDIRESKKRVHGWDALLAFLTTGASSGRRLPEKRAVVRLTHDWVHQAEFHTLDTTSREWLPRVLSFLESSRELNWLACTSRVLA